MSPVEPVTPPNSRVWRVLHLSPVLVVLAFVAGFLVLLVDSTAQAFFLLLSDAGDVLAACIGAAGAFGVYRLYVWGIERRRGAPEFGRERAVGDLLTGLALGIAVFSAVVLVQFLLGVYRIASFDIAPFPVEALAISILSGVAEETMFRALLFRAFERWLGSWAALAITAAMFGAIHLANPNASWFAALAIALEAGIMLGALYMLTRRLWVPIGVHAAWNFAQGGIYGIPVSGMSLQGLIVPRIAGPELLTGGRFGSEASLPALVVATAFGIAVLAAAHRRGLVVAPSWVRGRAPIAAPSFA